MLSSSTVKNVGQASHYFSEKDNYYAMEEGFQQSEWWGRAAQQLNLIGKVEDKAFTEMLNGQLPTGELLGKMVDGKINHRPGWDLTFSAPKSVSILALVGGDKRLMDAHRQAVTATLSHIEKACAQARVTVNSEMIYQNTGNLIGALYHHDLSRAKDPQLHTHSVIMNITERQDGKWRSLASSRGNYNEQVTTEVNGFIERIRHHNRYFSKIYESELAFRVQEIGYQIRTDTKSGIFEIEEVPQSLIDHFSKRRTEITDSMNEKGLSGGKAAAIATLSTRENKENADREVLHNQWLNETKQYGVNIDKIISNSNIKANDISRNISANNNELAINIIKEASDKLSVFQSTFTLEELITKSMKAGIEHKLNTNDLLNAATFNISQQNLISINTEQGKTVLMSQSTVEHEKAIETYLGKNVSLKPVINETLISQYLSQHDEINHETKSNLLKAFNNDKVILIEGENTKNQLSTHLAKIATLSKTKIGVISPNLVSSRRTAQTIKVSPTGLFDRIKSLFIDQTPAHFSAMQFINQSSTDPTALPKILLIENANLLSTYQKAKLIEINSQNDGKLIFFGENHTLLSQFVSSPLHNLKDLGIKTIISNKSESLSEDSVNAKSKINIHRLQNALIEVKGDKDRHQAIANHYSMLFASNQKNIMAISTTKQGVDQLNVAIHEKMKSLTTNSKSVNLNILTPIFVEKEALVNAESFSKNQVVRFNERYSSLSIERGDYLKVLRSSKHSNRVILQNDNGKRVIWRPDITGGISGKIELFQEKQRELIIGERLISLRSIKSKNIVKGERYTIDDIKNYSLKLRHQDGKISTIDINNKNMLHLDYGYAGIIHAIAHEKPDAILADIPARSISVNQRLINQLMSQSKQVSVYTNNLVGLSESLEKQTGHRLSANEILTKSNEMKNQLHGIYQIVEKYLPHDKDNPKYNNAVAAIEAVDYAMKHLAEREAAFTHKELLQTALTVSIGKSNQALLTDAARAMEKSGTLIRYDRNDGTLWTTHDAVKIEREIIAYTNQDKGRLNAIFSSNEFDSFVKGMSLRDEQIQAIKDIIGSSDRVLSIQGRAGTGKTTMLAALNSLLSSQDKLKSKEFQLQGIAPTHKAVKELVDRGINAQTIDSFLVDINKSKLSGNQIDHSKTILVIDEASMVSNRKMLDILKVAHELNFARVVSTGDTFQNPSIEAGKPHELIQRVVENVIGLNDIQRQKNTVLKEAALALYEGNVERTFSLLKNNITEIGDPGKREESYQARVKALVKDYFKLFDKSESVQIITPSHHDRKAVNALVRSELISRNVLSSESTPFKIMVLSDMTAVERSKATNFKEGQVLKFTQSTSKQIKTGDYFFISSIDKQHNLLTLTRVNNESEKIVWQISSSAKTLTNSVEVFRQEQRDLRIGDQIVWTKTNKKQGLVSAEIIKITNIRDANIEAKTHQGAVMQFNAQDPAFQHWDHAYALTTYSTQGGTYPTVLAMFESYRKNLMNLKTLLVTITRPVHDLRIYTDNQQALQNRIMSNKGDKLSSLEVLGEYPSQIKPTYNKTEKASKNSASSKSTPFKESTPPKYDKFTIDNIVQGLNQDAEKIAVSILGKPKLQGSNFVKFGSHQGSLSVTTKGERQGWWNDFSEGKGGRSMLSFVQKYANLSKQEALDYGAKWVGILPSDSAPNQAQKHQAKQPTFENLTKEEIQADRKKIAFANKLAMQSQPLQGTLAERYLKEQRGITLEKQPDDIRFHPNVYSKLNGEAHPAMLVIARDSSGKVKGVQATYLNPTTANKIEKDKITIQKQTFGVMKGAAVTVQGDKNSPTFIAEGVETALSLKQAIPDANVKITLSKSNLGNFDPRSLNEKVVLCLDNDGIDFKKDTGLINAAKRLSEHQKNVFCMTPAAKNNEKIDYNDVLKQQGKQAIQHDFNTAVSAKQFFGEALKIAETNPHTPKKLHQVAKQIQVDSQRKYESMAATLSAMTNRPHEKEQPKVTINPKNIEHSI